MGSTLAGRGGGSGLLLFFVRLEGGELFSKLPFCNREKKTFLKNAFKNGVQILPFYAYQIDSDSSLMMEILEHLRNYFSYASSKSSSSKDEGEVAGNAKLILNIS